MLRAVKEVARLATAISPIREIVAMAALAQVRTVGPDWRQAYTAFRMSRTSFRYRVGSRTRHISTSLWNISILGI